jgi:hypothetical protein
LTENLKRPRDVDDEYSLPSRRHAEPALPTAGCAKRLRTENRWLRRAAQNGKPLAAPGGLERL